MEPANVHLGLIGLYDNERAIQIWLDHGVMITKPLGDNFSMYNLSPANALFDVMDHERQLT